MAITAPPQVVLTDPNEIEHILRWRQYQQWIKALPPGLTKPLQSIRNPHYTALDTHTRPQVKHDNKMHRKPRAPKQS